MLYLDNSQSLKDYGAKWGQFNGSARVRHGLQVSLMPEGEKHGIGVLERSLLPR